MPINTHETIKARQTDTLTTFRGQDISQNDLSLNWVKCHEIQLLLREAKTFSAKTKTNHTQTLMYFVCVFNGKSFFIIIMYKIHGAQFMKLNSALCTCQTIFKVHISRTSLQ